MKIDFYILDTDSQQQAHLYVCRLLEKMYMENQLPVVVHTDARADAERLENLLWIYRDDSFLPHQLMAEENISPILIAYGEYKNTLQGTLINLGKEIPACYQQFEQIIEIVFTDENIQQYARQRYKHYRDLGLNIQTNKLKVN